MILLKGVDQIKKRLTGDSVPANRDLQGREERRGHAAAVAILSLLPERLETRQCPPAVAQFIGHVVCDSTEGVNVAEILAKLARQQERDDGEVLVMSAGQLPGIALSPPGLTIVATDWPPPPLPDVLPPPDWPAKRSIP